MSKIMRVLENLIYFTTFTVGAVGLSYLNLWISIAYLIFCLGFHGFLLRKIICTSCHHYGDNCHLGWGLLSASFFDKGPEREFENRMKKIGLPAWGLTWIWPIVGMSVKLFKSPSLELASFLTAFTVIIITSLIVTRSKGCSSCRMSEKCPIGTTL